MDLHRPLQLIFDSPRSSLRFRAATATAMETPGSNQDVLSTSSSTQTSMKPPPPKFLSNSDPNSSQEKSQSDTPVIPQSSTEPSGSGDDSSSSSVSSQSSKNIKEDQKQEQRSGAAAVPYTIPTWSGRPCHQFYLEVLKDGSIIDQFDVYVILQTSIFSFLISFFFCYAGI